MNNISNFGVPFDQGFYSNNGMSGLILGPRQTAFCFVFPNEDRCHQFLESSKFYMGLNFEDEHFVRVILRADNRKRPMTEDENFLLNPLLLSYSPLFMHPGNDELYVYATIFDRPGEVIGAGRLCMEPHFSQRLRSRLVELERGSLSKQDLSSLHCRRAHEYPFSLAGSELMNGLPFIRTISLAK